MKTEDIYKIVRVHTLLEHVNPMLQEAAALMSEVENGANQATFITEEEARDYEQIKANKLSELILQLNKKLEIYNKALKQF